MPGRRERDRLPVIAAGGGNHAAQIRLAAHERVHVDQAPANLEGAHRSMVFMLDPGLRPEGGVNQRPAKLRRRRHGGVHHGSGGIEVGKGRQIHDGLS